VYNHCTKLFARATTTMPYAEPVISAPTAGLLRRLPIDGLAGAAGGVRSPSGVARVEALMHRLCEGHGPAGEMVLEHLHTGGKRLRARLALAALEALGGHRGDGAAWAAACELLHNATLVHDDLQDEDRTRRGHPTTWALHGAAQAVNAGDLLLMLPFLALEQLPGSGETRWQLARSLAAHAASTVRGQADELLLAGSPEVRWDEYRHAVVGKTCALFLLPVEGAALLAGWEPAAAQGLARGFEHLGLLFQLQDDVLDLFGTKGRSETGSDLREGKISALVVEHLRLHPEETFWLRGLLAMPRNATPDDEVSRAIERFRSGGALDAVLGRIRTEAEATVGHPGLHDHPALREIATDLVDVALAPIAHVLAPR
jgi:geranylgeranyl diphosphate synthase type I